MFFLIVSSLLILPIQNHLLPQNVDFPFNDIQNSEPFDDSDSVLFNQPKFSYSPIESLSSSGDTFSVQDDLSVSHSFSLNLDSSNDRSNSFEIVNPSGYSNTSMNYNMTITTTKDDLNVRAESNDDDHVMGYFDWAYAQAFEVTWDYAVFYGANVYLAGAAVNDEEIDIFLVKATGSTGPPNMVDIRSSTLNGPFNSSNPLTGGFDYYDFEDVVIESGRYYIVANMSVIDGGSYHEFSWVGYQGSSNSDTYRHNQNGWTFVASPAQDCSLKVELMESDVNGDPLKFNNPTTIDLEDNAIPVSSRFQTINSIGSHLLTANSSHSYEFIFNNSYTFSMNYLSTSSFMAQNSTFGEYDISWTLEWSVNMVDLSPYSNPIKEHILYAPSDWNSSVFSTLLNNTVPTTATRISSGYEIDLDSLFQGHTFYEADIKLETTSPNYLYDSLITNGTLASTDFDLGYWTYTGSKAYGYSGSELDFDIFIKDSILNNVNTGDLNFSIYNDAGIILPRKTDVYSNISFTDLTNYTLLLESQISSGRYSASTFFDPSVFGTDIPGYWTVSFLWNNGSEVGIFTKTISVNAKTSSSFEWEQEHDSGSWVSDSNVFVNRIHGDYLNVRVQYFSQSEPYFEGDGIYISNAEVYYDTSWVTSSNLTYIEPYYQSMILIDGPIGEQNILLNAGGEFLSSYSKEINIKINYQFILESSITHYSLNFSNPIEMKFQLIDITNFGVNILPDDIEISIDDTIISIDDYSNSTIFDEIVILLDTGELGLAVGDYEIKISVSKLDYIESDMSTNSSLSVFLHIGEIPTYVEIISSATKIYHNNQTSIKFRFIDSNHSSAIEDAIISVKIDIEEVEIVTQYEESGLYTIVFRVFEPEVASMNVFINVTKAGYKSLINFHLSTLNILPSETQTPSTPLNGDLPVALIVILAVILFTIIGFVTFWYLRKYLKNRNLINSERLENARNLFQSALMIKKVLVIHNQTSLPVFEFDLTEDAEIDNALVSGVLEAISTIGTELMGAPTGIKKIEYYGFEVIRATSGVFTTYLFADSNISLEIVEGINNVSKWFDVSFGHQQEAWDGSLELFNEYEEAIIEEIVGELYIWLLYPLEILPLEQFLKNKMSTLEQNIYNLIEKRGNSTLIFLIDELSDFTKEEIIVQVLDMVSINYLKRNFNE